MPNLFDILNGPEEFSPAKTVKKPLKAEENLEESNTGTNLDSFLENVDEAFKDVNFYNEDYLLTEAYKEYDPKEGWTEEDIELHKSIDWKARNWKEFDTTEEFRGPIFIYTEEETKEVPNQVFHKFLRSNPIYSPYYRPIYNPGMSVVGPMFDGRTHNGYDVHDRYESQAVYDMLSEDLKLDEGLPPDLAQAYKNANASGDVDYDLSHSRLGHGRKNSPMDYGKATYKEISKEEALRRLKDRDQVESLRLIIPAGRDGEPRLIQFVDKGGYSDGKYYRPLYQLYYIERLPADLRFTNKNGSQVADSRKIPVKHLVEISSKIYQAENENPIGQDIIARRKNTTVQNTDSSYATWPMIGGEETREYGIERDTGRHDGVRSWSTDAAGRIQNLIIRLRETKKEIKKLESYLKEVSSHPEDFPQQDVAAATRNLASYKESYLKGRRELKDLQASFRYSYTSMLGSIRVKLEKLKYIKDQLRDYRQQLINLRDKGLAGNSNYEYELQKIKDLNNKKAELEKKLETATTGREDIVKQLEEIQELIKTQTTAIAQASGNTIDSVESLASQLRAVDNTIATFNQVASQTTQLQNQINQINQRISEAEDEIDMALADVEAARIIDNMKTLEKGIRDLEEQRRALFHKKVNNIAKEVNPEDPEFNLFRKPKSEEPSASNPEEASTEEDIDELEIPEEEVEESFDMEETYTDDELRKLEKKVFNQQQILNIYKREKYDIPQLFAHTKCVKCGKEKRVLLSNLVNDPDKYGSCKCSKENEEGRAKKIIKLYKGKRLPTNTSGYTGVYHLKTYNGRPYNKWRAVIEIDGEKHFLGDFESKKEAAEARRKAAKEGIKWYRDHNPYFKEN